MVDRIYRSLFVYTLGFYELLNEATKNMINDKLLVQSKIWKVF